MNKKLKLIFLSIAIFCSSTILAQNAYETIMANTKKAGGVYYTHDFGEMENTPAPKGYKPFYISSYARHGARYDLSDTNYDTLLEVFKTAIEEDALTDLGQSLANRFLNLYPIVYKRGGELSTLGMRQLEELGRRMYNNYPEIFKKKPKVYMISTNVPRCIISMHYFEKGLTYKNKRIDVFADASKQEMYYLNPHSLENPKNTEADYFIRSDKHPAKQRHHDFFEKNVPVQTIVSRLFTKTSSIEKTCSQDTFVKYLFSVTTNMQCLDSEISFSDIFTKDELFKLWEWKNSFYYTEKGPDPKVDGRCMALAESLLEDFIVKTEQDIVNGDYQVRLRYGHDGCLMALYALMDIGTWGVVVDDFSKIKDVWQTYTIPMGTNFRIVLYKSKNNPEILFKAYHNEKEIELPLNSDKAPYYSWDDFKTKYTEIVKDAQLFLETTKKQ